MTLSRASVEGLAALCGAIPDLAFAVTTTSGVVLEVAERPDAALCPHTFRRAVLSWPECPEHAPCIEDIAFDDFDESAGILSRAGERWLVSPLGPETTAEVLGGCEPLNGTVDALIREDLDLELSVVRLSSLVATAAELDEGALTALGVLITEHLCATAAALQPGD